MDINLPRFSSYDSFNILFDDSHTVHIPVVALSTNVMACDIEKSIEAGFFRYLTKKLILKSLWKQWICRLYMQKYSNLMIIIAFKRNMYEYY
jgi:CheY-like chemotaxis protein